jgi:hypothetical protein
MVFTVATCKKLNCIPLAAHNLPLKINGGSSIAGHAAFERIIQELLWRDWEKHEKYKYLQEMVSPSGCERRVSSKKWNYYHFILIY